MCNEHYQSEICYELKMPHLGYYGLEVEGSWWCQPCTDDDSGPQDLQMIRAPWSPATMLVPYQNNEDQDGDHNSLGTCEKSQYSNKYSRSGSGLGGEGSRKLVGPYSARESKRITAGMRQWKKY